MFLTIFPYLHGSTSHVSPFHLQLIFSRFPPIFPIFPCFRCLSPGVHPVFHPTRTDSSGLDASVVHSLAAYARASKFRRTCLQVMAWSLSNSEMAEVREAFMEPGWMGM